MLERTLLFVETFDSEFKGRKYVISKFLDTDNLTFINGTNLSVKGLERGKAYKCVIEPKGNKLVVTDVE